MGATLTVTREAPALRRRASSLGRLASTPGLALLGLALVVGLWALVASVSNPTKIPSVGAVLSALKADWHAIPAVDYIYFRVIGIGSALEYTAVNVVFGVAVGTAVGIPLGVVMARIRGARLILEPPLLVLGTVPLLVLLPFITFWFGTARFAQSGLVILFSLLTVTIATQSAAGVVSERYAHFAACLGASPALVLRTVVLPAAMPDVMAAIRVALAAGWGWEVVVENLGARQGLGLVVSVTSQLDDTASLMAGVLALVLAAVIADAVVAAVGAVLIRWKE
jgi:ABC-type nitrate/sulfonate/bicarbonate transport system permease component